MKKNLSALEAIVRTFVGEVLDALAEDIEDAKLEIAGKLNHPGSGCPEKIVAAEPALLRAETWYVERAG